MAKLIFIGEKLGGRIYEFAVAKTTVGRGDHNTLTIHDTSVSQSHCEIFTYNEDVIVRDLGSSNGTFVNGERLHNQQRPLKAGQTVRFGSVEARLELDQLHPSDTATEMTAIHSIDRQQGRQQSEPKEPAPFALTLETGSGESSTEHTLMIPQPAEAEKTAPAAALDKVHNPEMSSNWLPYALAAVGLTLVLALILWFIWGRG